MDKVLELNFSKEYIQIASEHMKRVQTSLITGQSKTTMIYLATSIRMVITKKSSQITSVDIDVEKLESLYIAGGHIKWFSCHGGCYADSSKYST